MPSFPRPRTRYGKALEDVLASVHEDFGWEYLPDLSREDFPVLYKLGHHRDDFNTTWEVHTDSRASAESHPVCATTCWRSTCAGDMGRPALRRDPLCRWGEGPTSTPPTTEGRLQTMFENVMKAGMDVHFHSDGNIIDIIPDQ